LFFPAVEVDGPSCDDSRVRVLPHFEVVGRDLLYWELSRLQYVEPPLLVDHSTICVGRQEVTRIQSVYGGEIGNAFMGCEHFSL